MRSVIRVSSARVSRAQLQEIRPAARDVVQFKHLVQSGRGRDEGRTLIGAIDLDKHERQEPQVDGQRVHARAPPDDDTSVLQPTQPVVGRRYRQPDLGRQVGIW